MSKKDLSNVTANLAALAGNLPTQNIERPRPTKSDTPAPSREGRKETIQVNLSMRKSLRKELLAMAHEADMTMRAYVLNALKEKGLAVTDEDLIDMRKRKR
ncbi:MAG: hypothetical protein RIC85_03865 [Gammaproteobacteria bacterium]